MPSISSMTKGEVQAALRELGEEPPLKWKLAELQVRLMELEEEKGINLMRDRKSRQTELMAWVTQLNQAMKKKEKTQQFCQTDLGMTLTGNETCLDLQRKAMEKIYQISTPDGQDPMGFGEHASRTYLEVKNNYPDYSRWATQTVREGNHGQRLRRFVKWLEMNETEKGAKPNYLIKQENKVKTEGYTKTRVKVEVAKDEDMESVIDQTEMKEMMTKMMETMGDLKEEINELRQERPRKKTDGKSDGSFSNLSTPASSK